MQTKHAICHQLHRDFRQCYSSIASPEPQIVTIDPDLNEPTMPMRFGRQLAIIPPNLNDLGLSPNSFNILATMLPVNATGDGHGDNYSNQSPEPSGPSPISTLPMNLKTIDGWETPHTTTDDITLYSEDKPKRIYLFSCPSPPSPPRKIKRKLEMGVSSPKGGRVSQHVCEACGQMIPSIKDILGLSTKDLNFEDTKTIFMELKLRILLTNI